MDPEVFYDRYIKDDFENNFVPHGFETICTQYLIAQNRAGLMEEPFERIGRYWYDDPVTRTNGEFDIVTADRKGYIFYEAKFRREPMDQRMIDEEILQVKRTGLNCYRYGFISRSGFSDVSGEGLILRDLRDLYG